MFTIDLPIIEESAIVRNLIGLSQAKATGKWILKNEEQKWQLYFCHGRLLYATGGKHRVRRWYRALKQHCPALVPEISHLGKNQLWEYQLLWSGISQKQLTLEQAISVIRTSIEEVFFAISGDDRYSYRWVPSRPPRNMMTSLEVEPFIQQAQQIQSQWQDMGLSNISPDMALYSNDAISQGSQNSSATFFNLLQLADGESTIWDIAIQMRCPVTAIARAIVHLVKKEIIELKLLPDLPPPIQPLKASPDKKREQPLIACIDDSYVVSKCLEPIITNAGYRLLAITEPLAQMSTLVKHKPDLILLDLHMPDTSGYNLCQFLRNTSYFQKTPIIIFTSHDSIVDRTRAKLMGANDFVSKPPEPKMLIQTINKYLQLI